MPADSEHSEGLWPTGSLPQNYGKQVLSQTQQNAISLGSNSFGNMITVKDSFARITNSSGGSSGLFAFTNKKQKESKATNAEQVYRLEFTRVFQRREYTQQKVQMYFSRQQKQINEALQRIEDYANSQAESGNFSAENLRENLCHNCQVAQVPKRGMLEKVFNDESNSPLYCHFCMHRVCSIDCLHEEEFVIPRLFNVSYDVNKHRVCRKAGTFLSKQNYIKIAHNNPQVVMRDELFEFMLRRRQLHKIFDMIKCETWRDIVERNGFAREKNLILKECYLTIQQLSELQDGLLMKKVKCLEKVLLSHFNKKDQKETVDVVTKGQGMTPLLPCKLCKVSKIRCEVC